MEWLEKLLKFKQNDIQNISGGKKKPDLCDFQKVQNYFEVKADYVFHAAGKVVE